jgi:hypothetical protein
VAPGSVDGDQRGADDDSANRLGTNNNLTIMTGRIVLPGIELPASDRAPLIMRPFGQELILCKRYLEKQRYHILWAAYTTGAYSGNRLIFSVEKRATPTVTLSNVSRSSANTATSTQVTTTGLTVYSTSTGTAALCEVIGDATADARL